VSAVFPIAVELHAVISWTSFDRATVPQAMRTAAHQSPASVVRTQRSAMRATCLAYARQK